MLFFAAVSDCSWSDNNKINIIWMPLAPLSQRSSPMSGCTLLILKLLVLLEFGPPRCRRKSNSSTGSCTLGALAPELICTGRTFFPTSLETDNHIFSNCPRAAVVWSMLGVTVRVGQQKTPWIVGCSLSLPDEVHTNTFFPHVALACVESSECEEL
jgi:hypothetical protein